MESRDNLHNIALLFMQQFDFELMSLDEFLFAHGLYLSPIQLELGRAILKQFEYED